ncbi:hypothetical protein NL676_023205 [Syzygium grande]|nr:hypothetical protein NL676_023205 [Syzygium grande]
MDLSPLSILTPILFLLPLFNHISYCQQPYIDNEQQLDCSSTLPQLKGYLCNGPQTGCQSFLTFRSTSLYNSPLAIASLLSSDALDIATINNIKSTAEKIPYDDLVIVPVPCYCTGTIYSHQATYTVAGGENYSAISTITFQGLSSCSALIDQNYYDGDALAVDAQLRVPLRCACPSTNETTNGVKSLLTYLVTQGDSVYSVAERYGISAQSVMEANMMTDASVIYPFTTILIPLNCANRSQSSFCSCPNGYAEGVYRNGLNCMPDKKKFPFKLVLVIGSPQLSANSVQQHFMPVARGYPLRVLFLALIMAVRKSLTITTNVTFDNAK